MQRHRKIARALYFGQCGIYGHVGRIALGGLSQIDGTLRKGNAAFGHAYLLHDLEGGVGYQHGVGIGQPYVFRCQYDHTARYELGVLASGYHAREPVHGCVGVAAADALDEGRDYVVVHLAVLVVCQRILLQTLGDYPVVDDYVLARGRRLLEQVEDVQELACVASGIAKECIGLLDAHCRLRQYLVIADGVVEK